MSNVKVYTTFNKVWSNCSENALKLNFEALSLTENLNPLQDLTYTLTPSSINTQNRPKYYSTTLYELFLFLFCFRFKSKRIFSKYGMATSKHQNDT